MDILQFISSVIASLSWPIATIILVLILRKPLKYLISSLGKFKYKDLEFEFRNLQAIGKSIPKLDKSKEIPRNERIFYSSLEMQVADIAPRSPESAILICWTALEVAIHETVARLAISPDSPSYRSAMHNIDCLKQYSKLDMNSLMAITALRDLRNRVAHGGRADMEQALNYEKITTNVIKVLQNVESK